MSEAKNILGSRFFKGLSSIWTFSGIRLTLFSLVILPSLVVLSIYFTQYMNNRLKEVFFAEYPPEVVILRYSMISLQWIVIFLILFVFPPYPFPNSIKYYFKKRGYENAVVEYEVSKKVLFVAVPAFIILAVVLPNSNIEAGTKDFGIDLSTVLGDPIFRFIQNYLLLVVFAGALKVMFVLLRRDFRLYYAKGCFKKIILQSDQNEIDVMNYLKKGLVAYNSYLRRNLNLQIKNLEEVIYKISIANQKKRNLMIREISIAFNKDDKQTMEYFHQAQMFLQSNKLKLENLTLTPLRKLYDYSQPLKPNEFLTEQSFTERIKDKIALIATIPPLVISIIEMFTRISKP